MKNKVMNNMVAINKILVPLSSEYETPVVARNALHLARKLNASLLFLFVLDDLREFDSNVEELHYSHDLTAHIKKSIFDKIERHINTQTRDFPNIDFQLKVCTGSNFIKIIQHSLHSKSDLIYFEQGTKYFAHNRFNSTAKHLMRKSEVPVWINTDNKPITNIVAAVDVTSEKSEAGQLNRSIVEHAALMASLHDAKVTLIHAWRLFGENYLRNWKQLDEYAINSLVQAEYNRRLKAINRLAKILDDYDVRFDIKMIQGRSAYVVSQFVEEQNTDLLVMGTLNSSNIAGYFIGQTAENTIESVNCSLITLKPKNFKTPVQVGLPIRKRRYKVFMK